MASTCIRTGGRKVDDREHDQCGMAGGRTARGKVGGCEKGDEWGECKEGMECRVAKRDGRVGWGRPTGGEYGKVKGTIADDFRIVCRGCGSSSRTFGDVTWCFLLAQNATLALQGLRSALEGECPQNPISVNDSCFVLKYQV